MKLSIFQQKSKVGSSAQADFNIMSKMRLLTGFMEYLRTSIVLCSTQVTQMAQSQHMEAEDGLKISTGVSKKLGDHGSQMAKSQVTLNDMMVLIS